MHFALHSLGALPTEPPRLLVKDGGLLLVNHEWVRYYSVDYKHQLAQCPSLPPFGCWMVNGYAWGQRENYPPEFLPYAGWKAQPLPPPFPASKKVAPPAAAPKKLPPPVMAPPSAPPYLPPVPSTPSTSTPVPHTSAPVPDLIHHMGGVVGIGLIIAMVLTAARKYK